MLGNVNERESGIAVIFKPFSLNDVLVNDVFDIVLIIGPRCTKGGRARSYQIGDKISLFSWHLLEYFKNLVTDDFFCLVNMGGGVVLRLRLEWKPFVLLLVNNGNQGIRT